MKKNRLLRIVFFILPVLLFSFFAPNALANTGTISNTYHTAGFLEAGNGAIDFNCDNCDIVITDTDITGHAWGDQVGWIIFDPPTGGVEVEVATVTTGVLSGYAWGQNTGWINFDPTKGGVTITTTADESEFNGYAWAQNYGWIKFDCSIAGIAAGQCVKTDWQPTLGGGPHPPPPPPPPPPPTDSCSNLEGIQPPLPPGYLPGLPPDWICLPIPPLFVSIEYPTQGTYFSTDMTDAEIASSDHGPNSVSPFTRADFRINKIKAKVTGIPDSGSVKFFINDDLVGIVGTLVSNTTDIYEIDNQYFEAQCPEASAGVPFTITVEAKNSTLGLNSTDSVLITVGRTCGTEATECSNNEDDDEDDLIDCADPGCRPDGEACDIKFGVEETDTCLIYPDSLICQCTEGLPTYHPENPICLTVCSLNPNILATDPDCHSPIVPPALTCFDDPSLPGCEVGTDPCLADPNSPECLNEGEIINSPFRDIILGLFSPEDVKKIDLGLKIAATVSVAVGTVVSLGTALFLNPLAAPELVLIPLRLWSLLLTALGLKKRIKPWGTVYDSITKQPLDPVYVSLLNLEGAEIASSITDIDGRYGFLVESGVYKVVPKKTNYLFPSDKLSKHFRDEFYQDLYFGDYMNIGTGEVIVKNVPMDPVNFDWNEFAKNKKQLFKFYSKKELMIARISNWLFSFGFTVAAIALLISPEKYNIIIFGLYIVMFILRRTSFKLKAKGRLLDANGDPLAFAFIRVYSVETNVEIAHKVADQMGRYYALVPNGTYYVKIEKKNNDGSYTLIHTSNYFKIVHGVLNRVFNI